MRHIFLLIHIEASSGALGGLSTSLRLDPLYDLFELREETLGEVTVLEDNPAWSLLDLFDQLLSLLTLAFTEGDRSDELLLLLTQALDLLHRVVTRGQD